MLCSRVRFYYKPIRQVAQYERMGVNVRITSGPAIEKAGDLAALLTNLNENDILFVDEIHRLNRAVEESLAAWYGVLSTRGIAPEVDLPDTPVVRPLNREAVSRILSNVLSNAARYSPGDLRIVLEENGTLTFSNAAPSLTPVLAERLFDRYFTVESGGQGTGLGLSIARRLTEQMGGTAAAGWQAGILTVRLYFPGK